MVLIIGTRVVTVTDISCVNSATMENDFIITSDRGLLARYTSIDLMTKAYEDLLTKLVDTTKVCKLLLEKDLT